MFFGTVTGYFGKYNFNTLVLTMQPDSLSLSPITKIVNLPISNDLLLIADRSGTSFIVSKTTLDLITNSTTIAAQWIPARLQWLKLSSESIPAMRIFIL